MRLLVSISCALVLACGGKASEQRDVALAGSGGALSSAGSSGALNSAGSTGSTSAEGGAAGGVADTPATAGSAGFVSTVTSSGTVSTHCDLAVTEAEGSNLPITRFDADHGNGMSTASAVHAFEASTVTFGLGYLHLNLTFRGAWPAVGDTYTLDPIADDASTSVSFAQDDNPASRAWLGVPGGVMTVHGIRQTTLPGDNLYTEVTFELKDLEFQPSVPASGSGAQGHFKFSGLCDGNFSDFSGAR